MSDEPKCNVCGEPGELRSTQRPGRKIPRCWRHPVLWLDPKRIGVSMTGRAPDGGPVATYVGRGSG